jgi:hypothetical protein
LVSDGRQEAFGVELDALGGLCTILLGLLFPGVFLLPHTTIAVLSWFKPMGGQAAERRREYEGCE